MTVSTIMITYNHNPYISQAIEGFLLQKTNFKIELIIADDASTDQTQEIIKKYYKSYPDIIKPILREKNIGANLNWIDAFKKCSGKYIALCEGDDYWTDPFKLQKQVDFLEENAEYSLCFHNALVKSSANSATYYFNVNKSVFLRTKPNSTREIKGYEILDNWIIPTASVVFRNVKEGKFDFFRNSKFGDIFLFLSAVRIGKIYYFEQISSVYRLVPTGLRNAYNNKNSDYIGHIKLVQSEFQDIEGIDFVCKKMLAIEYFKFCCYSIKTLSIKNFFKSSFYYFIVLGKMMLTKSPRPKYNYFFYVAEMNLRSLKKLFCNAN